MIKVGLIGNPNTGKTSLFNCLTGAKQHVGNWPGKTVEKKQGKIKYQNKEILIVDLPGTYSLAPYSEEEKIARNFILKQNPDLIVQIIDLNTLKRNLLITFELLSLNKKIVLAFNFIKEAKKRGIKYNLQKIKNKLKLPIVLIEANTGENKDKLLRTVIQQSKKNFSPPKFINSLLENKKEINHQKAFNFINKMLQGCYRAKPQTYFSQKLDALLLNKYLALPLFFLIMVLIFQTTFVLSTPFINFISFLFRQTGKLILTFSLPRLLSSFLVDGVINGVGLILSFAPIIFILFSVIAFLEDSGYLARTVVLTDRLLAKAGLSGRSFIPMMLGFGCNVPAIMATRTIKNKKEKLIAILTNPFISCSARLPVYMLFSQVFFPQKKVLIVTGLYFFSAATTFISSLILAKIIKSPKQNYLIIELPPYRKPVLRDVFLIALHQTKIFIKKAGTIIFAVAIIIWALANFPLGVKMGSSQSFLGQIGLLIAPIFSPLGFGQSNFAIALITGFIAKETIISTLGILDSVSQAGLINVLPHQLSPAGALAFLFFVLLYTPCLATFSAIKKETGQWKWPVLQVVFSLLTAWTTAFIVFQLAQIK